LKAIESAEQRYQSLVDRGWRPQEARSVFPNALSSKIIVTFNLRQWRHFFLMRTSKEAHPQMRQVTIPLLKEFKRLVPVLYEDIIPESRQIDNICKGQ
jgi:thymidylate synthase (FAD)